MTLADQINSVERVAADLHHLSTEGRLTPDQYLDIIDSVKRAAKLLSEVADDFEKGIKSTLNLTGEPVGLGNRIYFYKVTTAEVFDRKKAEKALKDAFYEIEDFYTTQERKSLTYTLNQ